MKCGHEQIKYYHAEAGTVGFCVKCKEKVYAMPNEPCPECKVMCPNWVEAGRHKVMVPGEE